MSSAAAMDYYAMIMVPTILLTVTGNATRVRPAANTILSNVPGAREKLYLDGAELQALYPLSIVTDGRDSISPRSVTPGNCASRQ